MMRKTVRCTDIGLVCDYIAISESEDELLNKMAEHAAAEHDIPKISAHIKDKLEQSIKTIEE